MTGPDPSQQLWWLTARASGVVALVLVTVSVGLGLAMAGRLTRRRGWPRAMTAIHEQAAVLGLVAILVHGIALLGDRWLHPGIAGVTVPFVLDHRRAFTGLGVLGGYLAALLGLSFYVRRWIGARRWRVAHRLTILVYVLAVVHTLGAGTDAGAQWLRAFMLATGIPIALLFVRRVLPRRPPALAGPPPAGRDAAGAGASAGP